MRLLLGVVAGVLAGLAAGAIWTWLQSDRYRADARVLIRPASSRVVPAFEALAESSLVAANVAQTLHLSSAPHVSAETGEGGVLTVSVEADSRERARQLDAEVIAVLLQQVQRRFGAATDVTATQLDPAHVAEQTSPTPGQNLVVAGLLGLVAGIAAALLSRPTGRPAVVQPDPAVEERLRARIDEVTKRELALARGAGELAAREQELERRQEELAAAAARPSPREQAVARREEALDQRSQELDQHSQDVEQRLDERERRLDERAAEVTAREAELLATDRAGWDLNVLEELVREQRGADSAQIGEWASYLYFLREHADHNGMLPRSFNGLIADVFADLPGLGATGAPRSDGPERGAELG